MNMSIFWLAALVIFLVIEIATMGLTTIWFAGGSLAAVIVAVVGGPLWLQITLFLVISALLLFFTRPVAVKFFNRERIKTNVDSWIGKQAIVQEQINNLKGTGRVTLDGNEWSARAEQEDQIFEPSEIVIVKAVKGVKLIVAK